MDFALHAHDHADGLLFETGPFTQRLLRLAPGRRDAAAADELLYVLDGSGRIDGRDVAPGTAVFVAAGTHTTVEADGELQALSVLVHDPEPAQGSVEVVDLAAEELHGATAGRSFVLGPACASATQFVGLVPPGRAPDHFHTYDEVIYVLEGEGELLIGGESAPLSAGSCIHLPARLVHCVANTGDGDLRLLGVFRPAGSPAEAYYPDGTPALVPEEV
jgi:mannose-6-phosphate isomerase-like protein (cupin superfamily)